MPYQFREQERQRYTDAPLKWDVPFNTWLGVQFGGGYDATLGNVLSKNVEESIWDNGDLMSPKLANKVFGIEGELEFTEPISIQKARVFRERKDQELRLRAYSEVADHSWLSTKAAAGFAAGVVGSVAHPVDLALGFLISPIGSAAKAGQATSAIGRFAARRLVTTEALQALKYPKLTEAVIEGTFGNLVAEIPVYLQAQKEQADYTLTDSLINIGAGGIFSGGLHLAARGIDGLSRRLKSAATDFSRLTPETKVEASKVALDQTLRDEDIDVSKVVALDKNVIEAEVRFNEAEARARSEAAVADESLDIQAAATEELGRPALEGVEAVNNANRIKVTAPEGATSVRVTTADGKVSVQPIDNLKSSNPFKGADIATIEAGTIGKGGKFQPMEGKISVVEASAGKGRKLATQAEFDRKVVELTNQRIKDYVESLRRDHEAQSPKRIAANRDKAAASHKAEHDRVVHPERQKELSKPAKVDAEEAAAVEQEANQIISDISKGLSEEEKAMLQKELEDLQAEPEGDMKAAVDAGVTCVTAQAIKGSTNG